MGVLDDFNHTIRGPKDGKKLVFLHGLMGSWSNWRGLLGTFETEYEILAYDQRGHGRSKKPETGYGPEDFAEDLMAILDELGWKKVYLVGHSMGGRNALVFTSRYPDRVEKLVIEDIGPEGSPENIARIEGILNRVPTPFHDKRVAKETILSAFEDPVLANYLYANIAEVSPSVFDWRFSKSGILHSVREGRSRDRWAEIQNLSVPTLLIRGENSDELSPELYQRVLDSNPCISGVVIPGAGHWVHFDAPKEFTAALQSFFK